MNFNAILNIEEKTKMPMKRILNLRHVLTKTILVRT